MAFFDEDNKWFSFINEKEESFIGTGTVEEADMYLQQLNENNGGTYTYIEVTPEDIVFADDTIKTMSEFLDKNEFYILSEELNIMNNIVS